MEDVDFLEIFAAVLIVVTMFIVVFSLGASKKTEFVEVTIQNVYTDSNQVIIMAGKVPIIKKRTDYIVECVYDGDIYKFENHDLYEKYKGKVGTVTKGSLQIITYKDGSIKKEIIAID